MKSKLKPTTCSIFLLAGNKINVHVNDDKVHDKSAKPSALTGHNKQYKHEACRRGDRWTGAEQGRGKTRFMASFGAHFPLHWTPSGAASRRRRRHRFPRFVFVVVVAVAGERSGGFPKIPWPAAVEHLHPNQAMAMTALNVLANTRCHVPLPLPCFPLFPHCGLLLWWASQRGRAHMTAYDLQCFVLFRLASTWHIKLINLASRAALRPHDISALHIWQCNCATTVQLCPIHTWAFELLVVQVRHVLALQLRWRLAARVGSQARCTA